jgi:hypothetical protein
MRTSPGSCQKFLAKALAYKGDECLFWPYSGKPGGYPQIWLDGTSKLLGRVVCERVHGPPPTPEHEAAHSCGRGNKGCITPRHLRWATHAENVADRVAHGTAKLTAKDVRAIRRMVSQGTRTQKQLAARFGVGEPTISKIVRREMWVNV